MTENNCEPFQFNSRRSNVYGTKHIVATSQPLATQAGLDILKLGGNAADAAVAAAACLNVTEPCSTGIGGDAFCLFYKASEDKIYGLNGSGRSPSQLTLDIVLESLKGEKHDTIPARSPHAITVPGACGAMVDTVEKFGSNKLDLSTIFQPAIELAEEGYPVSEITADGWKNGELMLKEASPNGDEMLVDGKAPVCGQIIKLPNLAKTYRKVATEGKAGFYKGEIAQAIVDVVKVDGGLLSLTDLETHKTEFVEPISYKYQDKYELFECPPNGQGITALLALGILDILQKDKVIPDIKSLKYGSVEYLHILIEVLRIAFVDTRHYVTDPNFIDLDFTKLLNEEYLRERSKEFNSSKANVDIKLGSPINSSNTVYLSTCDKEGNFCSFIMSNYAGFGSARIPKGFGFTLQNRGSNFYLDPKAINKVEGSKRPYHTIIPAMIKRDGQFWVSYGVMGGFMQPQGHLQVLLSLVRGNSPQFALDLPRFCIDADNSGAIFVEPEIESEVVQKLITMGHQVKYLNGFKRGFFGRGQIIQLKLDEKTNDRVLVAGSDPRADGQAAGR